MSDDKLSDDIFNSPEINQLSNSIRILTLAKCSSTQKLLLDWWERQTIDLNYTPVLNCTNQQGGIGQKNRSWKSNEGSLTFSLVLPTHSLLSLTPLEIALLCRNFLFENFQIDLKLKWPNDLVDPQNKKYGGIICHSRRKYVVVGIGLNIYFIGDGALEQYSVGYIFEKQPASLSIFLHELVKYIVNNRYLNSENIRADWLKHCNHLKKSVSFEDDGKKTQGIFMGLGQFGEALIQDQESNTHYVTNGSLTIDESSNSN